MAMWIMMWACMGKQEGTTMLAGGVQFGASQEALVSSHNIHAISYMMTKELSSTLFV